MAPPASPAPSPSLSVRPGLCRRVPSPAYGLGCRKAPSAVIGAFSVLAWPGAPPSVTAAPSHHALQLRPFCMMLRAPSSATAALAPHPCSARASVAPAPISSELNLSTRPRHPIRGSRCRPVRARPHDGRVTLAYGHLHHARGRPFFSSRSGGSRRPRGKRRMRSDGTATVVFNTDTNSFLMS